MSQESEVHDTVSIVIVVQLQVRFDTLAEDLVVVDDHDGDGVVNF